MDQLLHEYLAGIGFEFSLTEDRCLRVRYRLWVIRERVSSFSFSEDFSMEEILTDFTTEAWLTTITGARKVCRWEM